MGLQVGPEGIRGGVQEIGLIDKGNDGFVERVHFLFKGLPQGITLFPVPPLHGGDIVGGGVVEVYGQMPGNGLCLDLCQNIGLLFGEVGFVGIFILLPQTGKLVSVVSHGAGEQRCGAGHEGQHPGEKYALHNKWSLFDSFFLNYCALLEQRQGIGHHKRAATYIY